jgi:hypothetical protein
MSSNSEQFRQYVFLDRLAKLLIITGLALSLYDFAGLTAFNQVIELGVAAGFRLRTYLFAKSKPQGCFWLMVGNISAASIMMRQAMLNDNPALKVTKPRCHCLS